MNPQICQDIFTLSILLHAACHLEIDEGDKRKEFFAVIGRSYPFTVDFIYILGTDYDTTHAAFGFASDYPENADPLSVQQNGVAITGEQWNPQTPNVAVSPTAMQAAIYSAVLSFSSVPTIFDALIALSSNGQARINPLFGGVLEYNQGV